jgi:hypothetical protein
MVTLSFICGSREDLFSVSGEMLVASISMSEIVSRVLHVGFWHIASFAALQHDDRCWG